MTKTKAIEAKGLTKRYGDFTAIDHISFDVYQGDIFGLPWPQRSRENDNYQDANGSLNAYPRRGFHYGL